MMTGEIRSKIDAVWNAFWAGGIANPLEVIEQITYLLFLRRLDDLHTLEENRAVRLKQPMERRIFPKGKDRSGEEPRSYEDFRWSRFKHFAPAEMYTVVSQHVFPFLRGLPHSTAPRSPSSMPSSRRSSTAPFEESCDVTVPKDPAIFHITHVDNLPGIVREGCLWCDKERISRGLVSTNVGYRHIKDRRLRTPVRTAAGGMLGDYVLFNFCARSVMLFKISKGHQDYAGGQDSIVHLVSSAWRAAAIGHDWAFTDRHAELEHALHFDDLAQLAELPWDAIGKIYWPDVREEKQAEFLVRRFFPWTAVAEIGVMSDTIAEQVKKAIQTATHQPAVKTRPEWYY